jgi:hypothetical protein
MDKATFVGKSPDGSKIRISQTKKGQKVLASRGTDGSIIQDTRETSKTLENILVTFFLRKYTAFLFFSANTGSF